MPRTYFVLLGVQSALLIPLFLQGQFWGIFGFADCHRERTFTEDEIDILHSAGLMIVSAINRINLNHSLFGRFFRWTFVVRCYYQTSCDEIATHFSPKRPNRVYHEIARFDRPPCQKQTNRCQLQRRQVTSNAGVALLPKVDQKLQLTERINTLIRDPRDPWLVAHQQEHLLAQRLDSLALGDEDVNDQKPLRKDPALLAAIKNDTNEELPLGSSSTLSRLFNSEL